MDWGKYLTDGVGKVASGIGGVVGGVTGGIVGKAYEGQDVNVNEEAFAQNANQQQMNQSFGEALAASQNRKTPKVDYARLGQEAQYGGATIDQAQQAQFRNQQMGLAQSLQNQANGIGPSLAQMQLQQGTDRNLAQAMALSASMRGGGNAAMRMRGLQNQTAQIGQQAAQQAAMTRLAEQQQAQSQLAGVLDAGRAQDIGLATNQAGLQQQAGLANMDATNQFILQQAQLKQQARLANQQAALANQGQMDQMAQFYQGGLMNSANNEQASQMALEQLKAQNNLAVQGVKAQGAAANMQAKAAVIGGLANAGATIATAPEKAATTAASDKNLKTDVKSGKGKVEEFLNALSAKDYKYKDDKFGKGRFVSPMAQDLEKTSIGKSAVIDSPEGKMVDYGRLAGALLSSQGVLNDRLSDIEKALKMKKARA